MSRNLPLPDLPEEIITNILSKLPVKSLLKFKCVSKPWFSLISSPQFTKLHLQQLKLNNTACARLFMNSCESFDPQACSDYYENATIMEHAAIMNDTIFLFVGSCDGLICGTTDGRNKHLVVFNPTTQQVREIPVPNCKEKGRFFCGFGYDSKIDDYKIVRGVVFSSDYDGVCIEIFNLKGNSWRTIQTKHWCGGSSDDEAILLPDLFYGEGVFLNGVLHWLDREDIEIVRFDLVEEKFLGKMSIPVGSPYISSLIVIDECLWLYELRLWTFSAWKMINYGDQNSWTEAYEINPDIPKAEDCHRLLYVTKNGHLLFDIDTAYVILYNPVDDEAKQIDDEAEGGVHKTVYIESLVSPNVAD